VICVVVCLDMFMIRGVGLGMFMICVVVCLDLFMICGSGRSG
jgi:hypothetical protein